MSSMPPNMPPGGGAPPPYDPKMQWRIYREQQKAAWRSQRDAWRAQRHAWRASYGGAYGPCAPSMVGPIILVCIGVVALLVVTGHMDADNFWAWYGKWWPLLLIGAGLALLAEWALDLRRETPVRRSGNFVGLLVVLAIVGGVAAVAHNHLLNGFGNNQFFSTFGLPEHDYDQTSPSLPLPANATLTIENLRGDVSITAGDQPNLEVQAHEVAFAHTDSEAKKIFDAEAAHVTVNGSAVLIQAQESSKGRVNLTISLPRTAKVTVKSGWGDVTAAGLGAGIDVTARGDIHLNSLTGPVVAHFVNGMHDEFAAHDVQGDLTLEGDLNDLTLSEIKGTVTQNGDILGDVHMESISGAVHLHTSVTQLELGELTGDLTLDNDDLRVVEAKGPIRVVTHSKDVDLSQIYGDSNVEDRDGSINVEPAGAYNVDATNNKGDVVVTLPPDASATVTGHTHNGDIMTAYELTVSGDQDKTVSGKIGSGAARIVLSASNGDLHIKKGPAFPAEGQAPTAAADATAGAANGRHLKSTKPLPPNPVTQ